MNPQTSENNVDGSSNTLNNSINAQYNVAWSPEFFVANYDNNCQYVGREYEYYIEYGKQCNDNKMFGHYLRKY